MNARDTALPGFLLVANHGIDRRLIDDVLEVSMKYFDRPAEERRRTRSSDARPPRGYQAFARRNLARTYGLDAPPDLRENAGTATASGAATVAETQGRTPA